MKRTRKIKIILCSVILVTFFFAAFYNGLVVRKYIVHSDKLKTEECFRIVLLADLHNHIHGEDQTKLISLIQKQKPDMIALAGDIADDEASLKGTERLLEGLQGLAPTYYVTGNHEYWSNDVENIKNTIRKYDVTILEHNYEPMLVNNTSIIVGGVDDPEIIKYEKPGMDWRGEMETAFAPLQDHPNFKILLSHRPELIETYEESNFDLVLSGHAHGGQARIPFILNGLLAPNQGWFPKYAGGAYDLDTFTLIVSRGLSYNPRLPRIFNPPEVVVVDVAGGTP